VNTTLDDRTVRYVMAAQPVFEDLRQVASQVAGLLVLAGTGSKDASPHHPMLESAKLACAQALDGVSRVFALTRDHTRAHHRNLVDAAAALTDAVASADSWPIDIDAVMTPLRTAYSHLQSASTLLPGFQMVSFEQACCGQHLYITKARENTKATNHFLPEP
jgi:hypothetical protein